MHATNAPETVHGSTIVVVDDEERVRAMLLRFMAHAFPGARALAFASPAEALHAMSRSAGDGTGWVVVSDLERRDDRVVDCTLGDVRRRFPRAGRVLCTAYFLDAVTVDLSDASPDVVLAKPMSMSALRHALLPLLPAGAALHAAAPVGNG